MTQLSRTNGSRGVGGDQAETGGRRSGDGPGPTPRRPRRRRPAGRLALAVAAATLATVLAAPLGPSPVASAVPAAPLAAAPSTITVNGHGFGHGRGLGQYGAYGYAQLFSWTSAQILDHFYGNTTAGSVPADTQVTVRLTAQDGLDPVVSSATDFTIAGIRIAGGSTGRVALVNGQWTLFTSYGCGMPEVFSTPISGGTPTLSPELVSTVADPAYFPTLMLGVCEGTALHNYRGTLREALDSGSPRTVDTLALDDYLKGVVPQEMPSAWPVAALEAQAVAARSFAVGENRTAYAKTCDTTSCQVYRGFSKGSTVYEASSTSTAVANVANQVRMLGGGVARTEFSSSTGGYSAGGLFPAVVDDGDAIAANANHNWTATLDASTVAATYNLGQLVSLAVTARNGLGTDGGRATTIQAVGTTNTVTVSGTDFRTAFNLRSDWISFAFQPPPLPTFFLRHSSTTGAADATVTFGDANGVPLLCDWNGDGVDTPASFVAGRWTVRNSLATGPADLQFSYGLGGDLPVCGDWNGDGTDTPGVVRNGTWYLSNTTGSGSADVAVAYGLRTDQPVVGDWNNDQRDTPGVVRNGTWYLTNSTSSGTADIVLGYGLGSDRPVAGDWNGDGTDTPGVVRNGTWYLRNSLGGGTADLPPFAYGGADDRRVLAADGDGNGTDGPALARNFAG